MSESECKTDENDDTTTDDRRTDRLYRASYDDFDARTVNCSLGSIIHSVPNSLSSASTHSLTISDTFSQSYNALTRRRIHSFYNETCALTGGTYTLWFQGLIRISYLSVQADVIMEPLAAQVTCSSPDT